MFMIFQPADNEVIGELLATNPFITYQTPTSELPTPPQEVPAPDGSIPFGIYNGALPQIDYRRFAQKYQWPAWMRFAAEKRWRFSGIFGKEVIIGATVVRAGIVSNIFGYIFERHTSRLNDFAITLPGGLNTSVQLRPEREHVSYRGIRGDVDILTTADGKIHLSLHIGEITIEASYAPPAGQLVLVSRVPNARAQGKKEGVNITRKLAGMNVQGKAQVGNRTYSLDECFSIVDDTHGLLGRETRWRWASAAGRSAHGTGPVWGINLVAGHNDYEYSENGIWKDGELFYVGHTSFDFDSDNPLRPWHIHTDDDAVDLTFTPEGMRAGDVGISALSSYYRAPLGSYSGTLLGEEVQGIPGMAENHIAHW